MQYAIITFRPLCSTVHQIPGLNLFFCENVWIGNSLQDFKLCILKDSDTKNTEI